MPLPETVSRFSRVALEALNSHGWVRASARFKLGSVFGAGHLDGVPNSLEGRSAIVNGMMKKK